MWNFVGRQSDEQGKNDNLDGNWISGIKPLDSLHLGSQDNLPSDVLNNKGRNVYYFLPFILGLIGLMYHANKDLKSFLAHSTPILEKVLSENPSYYFILAILSMLTDFVTTSV